MYNTGIFSKIGFEHWEVGFRKKQWAGKWAWYPPPSGPSMNTKCKDASNKENKRFILKTLQNTFLVNVKACGIITLHFQIHCVQLPLDNFGRLY